jgi:hypothetical protein
MKMRPDILFIKGHKPGGRPPKTRRQRQKCTVQIVEVGYCPDTRWKEKTKEKAEQHATLVRELRRVGWKVEDPYIFTFGVGGTIFQESLMALRRLGVNKRQAESTLRNIHIRTVQWADKLVMTRRNFPTNATSNQFSPGIT